MACVLYKSLQHTPQKHVIRCKPLSKNHSTTLVSLRMCSHSLARADRGSLRGSGILCTSLCFALALNAPPLPRTLACCAVSVRRGLVPRDPLRVRTRRLYTMLCERLQEKNALLCAKGSKVYVSPISSAGQSVGLMSLRPRVRAPHGAFLCCHYFAYLHIHRHLTRPCIWLFCVYKLVYFCVIQFLILACLERCYI